MRSPGHQLKRGLTSDEAIHCYRSAQCLLFYVDIELIRVKFIVGLITVKLPNETIFNPLHSNCGVIEAGQGATY